MKNKALYTFRRNQLHVEDICKRIIQHGLENLEDQECVKRIFRILIHLLEYIVKLVGEQEGHNLKAKENGARQKIYRHASRNSMYAHLVCIFLRDDKRMRQN